VPHLKSLERIRYVVEDVRTPILAINSAKWAARGKSTRSPADDDVLLGVEEGGVC